MTTWNKRSPVTAAMFNPAMTAAIVSSAADGYGRASDQALPWPLTFIVAPLVLHRGTRQALPTTISTNMATWIARNHFYARGSRPAHQTRGGSEFDGKEDQAA